MAIAAYSNEIGHWRCNRLRATIKKAILLRYSSAGDFVYSEKGGEKTDYLSLQGKPVAELKLSGSTTTYLHSDLLGSPRKATNDGGAVLRDEHYDPYGAKLNGVSDKIGYTGHVHDAETGYTYMQARFYDA